MSAAVLHRTKQLKKVQSSTSCKLFLIISKRHPENTPAYLKFLYRYGTIGAVAPVAAHLLGHALLNLTDAIGGVADDNCGPELMSDPAAALHPHELGLGHRVSAGCRRMLSVASTTLRVH